MAAFGWAGAAAGANDQLQEMLARKRTIYLQQQAEAERQAQGRRADAQSARADQELQLQRQEATAAHAERARQAKIQEAGIAVTQASPGQELTPDVTAQIQGTPYASRLNTQQSLPSSTIPIATGMPAQTTAPKMITTLRPTQAQEQAQGKDTARRRVVELFQRNAPKNEILGALAESGENIPATELLKDPNAEFADFTKKRDYDIAHPMPSQAQAEYEWVVRGGKPVQIRKGKAVAGDAPYDATAARQSGENGPSDYSLEHAQRNIEAVDTLIKKVGIGTAGFGGSVLGNIPGTPARDFAAELNTLKANIAFSELTAMREASKSGGALGQISDREETLLSSTLGALDPGQSPANLVAQLQKIRESVKRWQAAQAKYGKGPMATTVDPNHLGHVPDQGGSGFRVVGSR